VASAAENNDSRLKPTEMVISPRGYLSVAHDLRTVAEATAYCEKSSDEDYP